MRVHYRIPLNFTWEGMKEAQGIAGADRRMAGAAARNRRETKTPNVLNAQRSTSNAEGLGRFEEALDDDLNISAALGFLFESIRETNRAMDQDKLDAETAKGWLNWWERINTRSPISKAETCSQRAGRNRALAKEREQARRARIGKKATNCAMSLPLGLGGARYKRRTENYTANGVPSGASGASACALTEFSLRRRDRKIIAMIHVRPEMFAPADLLDLEHTAHPKLFENQNYVWDALKQIASYLQFRLKPGVLGEVLGKPFISNKRFYWTRAPLSNKARS